jgi:hypothetical protein
LTPRDEVDPYGCIWPLWVTICSSLHSSE